MLQTNHIRGAVQMQIATIGLDIAKNVFQVHGIDAKEKVVARKQLRRSQMIKIRVCDQPCRRPGHLVSRCPTRSNCSPTR